MPRKRSIYFIPDSAFFPNASKKLNFLNVRHSGINWGATANAIGSGGGEHARLAKRNIEICAACHDEQGSDPICMMCHIDRIPGKGNDVKTHKSNFFKSIRGEWHEDDSSICFNCHSKNIASPIGFCKYCHN